MSVPDASRAYRAGVVQVALNVAVAALNDAFVAAMALDGFEADLVTAILKAQDDAVAARAIKVDWHA